MKLTVIGCSGSYPGPESPASCYLVEVSDDQGRPWRLLLDLGNGALGSLQRLADPLAVDAVFISHLHADHCLDLCGYYVLRKYHPDGAQPMLPVYGPQGIAERMAKAYDLNLDPGMNEEFDFLEYSDPAHAGTLQIGPISIEPIPVYHPVEAYGFRITAHGSTLGYSGDTALSDGVERVAAGADLFLCEASFRDGDPNPAGVHLTGVEAGQLATGADASRLVLTHVPPWFDQEAMLAEARRTYSGPAELARVGAVYEF